MLQKNEFKSKYLNTQIKTTMLTPDSVKDPKAVLILLHGSFTSEGDYSTFDCIPNELNLQRLCDDNKILVILPFMERNCYYISSNGFDCDSFLAKELPAFACEKHPEIKGKEIVLGGYSMGGYGAVLVGIHTRRFKRILSISGAFIQNDLIIGNPEICGQSTPDRIAETESFMHYFKPFSDLEESSDRNVVRALQTFPVEIEKPSIFLSCGSLDRLYKRNLVLVRELQEQSFEYCFTPFEGGKHDFECFSSGIQEGVKWLF